MIKITFQINDKKVVKIFNDVGEYDAYINTFPSMYEHVVKIESLN